MYVFNSTRKFTRHPKTPKISKKYQRLLKYLPYPVSWEWWEVIRFSNFCSILIKENGYGAQKNGRTRDANRKRTWDNIYIRAPRNVASNSGTSASKVCCGGLTIAAPDPIPDVVYINWNVISEELKQLSRVTVSLISGSCGSANSISTHCKDMVLGGELVEPKIEQDIHYTVRHHASRSPPLGWWPCHRYSR